MHSGVLPIPRCALETILSLHYSFPTSLSFFPSFWFAFLAFLGTQYRGDGSPGQRSCLTQHLCTSVWGGFYETLFIMLLPLFHPFHLLAALCCHHHPFLAAALPSSTSVAPPFSSPSFLLLLPLPLPTEVHRILPISICFGMIMIV